MIQRVENAVEAGRVELARAGPRERCPTCGARRRGESVCTRCRTDLGLLVALEAQADDSLKAACSAYLSGRHRTAMAQARNALRIELSSTGLRLLALSALRAGDFATALKAARRAIGAEACPGYRAP